MGKAEGSVAREEWHGHVTALSVAPEFRRLGLAAKLMEMLEEISERFVSGKLSDFDHCIDHSPFVILKEGRILCGSVCASVQPGCCKHVQTSGLQRLQDSHRVLLCQQRGAR